MSELLGDMTNEELWELFPIILKEHSPVYKGWYENEEKLLFDSIGASNIERINHIGSTFVDGLIAKPTVDILLEIKKDCNTDKLIKGLETNGYIFSPQPNNPPLHMMFMKGYTEEGFAEKVFHLHVRYIGDWNELYFRDYLSLHEDVAKEYSNLKMKLKDKYEHDRDAYTVAKTDFILKYTAIAREEFKGKYIPQTKGL